MDGNYKEQIETALQKIGWSLKDVGCGYFRFVNHADQQQPLVFFHDRIELEKDHYQFSFSLYLKDVEIDIYPDGNGVGFRGSENKNIFLNCYNFSRGK